MRTAFYNFKEFLGIIESNLQPKDVALWIVFTATNMNDVPKAKRDKESWEYRQPNYDPLNSGIEPDRVSSSCMGYFRIPAVWIEQPMVSVRTRAHLVDSFNLVNGISIQTYQDGYFVFDFNQSSYGQQVYIPGYTRPENASGWIPTAEHQAAGRASSKSVIQRTRLVNVHQALFTASERLVASRGAMSGIVISPRDLSRSILPEGAIDYSAHPENTYSMAVSYLSGQNSNQFPTQRRVIELEVVRATNNLLNLLAKHENQFDRAIKVLDQLYVASEHSLQGRSGLALSAVWVVIEGQIQRKWDLWLNDRDLSAARKKKLNSRDFTSSMKIEILESHGMISQELFSHLETARKSRNKWMHELEEPVHAQLYSCAEAAQKLFQEEFKVPIFLSLTSYSGEDASWPVSMDRRSKVVPS